MNRWAISLLVCAVACAALGEPFCALRFGDRYTRPEKWREMRAALEKNAGAFDEVWFSTGCTFPKLAWHERQARECAAAAADLRRMGIVPSVEIQTVIGHSEAILAAGDCTGQDWSTWVNPDGSVSKHVSCPHDPRLAAYFARVGELHAAWKPGSLWIDDDVTLRSRKPNVNPYTEPFGCFCERCLADFAKREGRTWKRGELAAAIRADKAVAQRWEDYQSANFAALVKTIAEAVHRISPETVFGYQYGFSGRPAIVKGLFDGSGIPVRLRPGAGAYWDSNPYDQIQKAYKLQARSEMMGHPDWIGLRCPEIETCPRTFASRTAQSIIVEAFVNLGLGLDFLSMFIANARAELNEPTSFYADRLFPRIRAARPFLEGYRDANAGTFPCGFTFPDEEPPMLVSCRGFPVVGTHSRNFGPLPDVTQVPIPNVGFGEGKKGSPEHWLQSMRIISSASLKEYYAICDRASGGRLPAVFSEAVLLWTLPRVKADGTLVSLAVLNASIDRQDPVGVRLRGVKPGLARAVWRTPESPDAELPLEWRGREALVSLPRIGAWECGYLLFR